MVQGAYVLRLYIAGQSQMSQTAVSALRRICAEDLHEAYTIEIIDVIERPQLAEDEQIVATPTLIKRLPPPLRRVIGDLSNRAQVLIGLDLKPLVHKHAQI
ncbi:MAG TPA: circadian clock KaiB family protein [Oligoflexus sp.]|uniref:circadian clock KaiB family protein n=1 Tax=Oligoflexus sp. TaxID=1971216 RepID=UPI002D5ED8B6|nr:circadian clock KaiB family protein [Oligoflexus sp.]HYX39557.1 circadian clock KaiB family protein [Oligoflexus sp.]